MKKRILFLFLTVASILAVIISSGAITAFAEGEDSAEDTTVDTGFVNTEETPVEMTEDAAPLYTGLDQFEKIGSSSGSELYMLDIKNKALVFAFKDIESGTVTYSTPASCTKIKTEKTFNDLCSAGILNYQDSQTVSQKVSTGSAVAAGNYKIEKLSTGNGVRVVFDFPGAEAGLGFTVPMTFAVTDNHFDVSVEMNSIVIDPETKSSLLSVAVMPYYGSAGYDEDGYMLIPDGSGALIYNNFTALDGGVKYYNTYVYGRDEALNIANTLGYTEDTTMPVFGTKAGDQASFAIITAGDAVSMVKAVSARESFPYTTNYCEFIYNKTDTFKTKTTWNQKDYQQVALEPTDLDSATVQLYSLSGDDADYVGMANIYRDYLVAQGAGSRPVDSDFQFYLETVGAFQKTESVAGFVVDVTKTATTFDAAGTMLTTLKNDGVDNLNLRYIGWMKNGVETSVVTNAAPESKLGGKSALKDLSATVNSLDAQLYLDAEFLEIYKPKGGWGADKFAVRNILNNYSKQYLYKRNTGTESDYFYYLCNPQFLDTQITKFFKDFSQYGITNLSAGSLGDNNFSDLNNSEKNYLDAQQVRELTADGLASIGESLGANGNIMVDGGNGYSLVYADTVIAPPMYCSGYEMTFTDVPFVQLVLHGIVNYTESVHNLCSDPVTQKLRQLETGSASYYILTDEESSTFLNTKLNTIFSSQFDTWREVAVSDYKEIASVLNGYCDKPITNHQIITEKVRATTYGDSMTVLVNYSTEDYKYGDITVPAEGYTVTTADKLSSAAVQQKEGE